MPAPRAPLGRVAGAKTPPKKRPARGTTIPPAHPTGRLLFSNPVSGGSVTTHWLPDPIKTGEYSWKCPLETCGQWFHWSVDDKEWKPA